MSPVPHVILFFLAVLVMVQSSLALYTMFEINSTMASELCAPEITLPSSTPRCTSQCDSLHSSRVSCSNVVGCLCRRAPPDSFQQCIDCVVDTAGMSSPGVPQFRAAATAQVGDYAAICSITLSLPDSVDAMNLTDAYSKALSSACLPDDTALPPSLLTRRTFRRLYPYAAFMLAVLVVLYALS